MSSSGLKMIFGKPVLASRSITSSARIRPRSTRISRAFWAISFCGSFKTSCTASMAIFEPITWRQSMALYRACQRNFTLWSASISGFSPLTNDSLTQRSIKSAAAPLFFSEAKNCSINGSKIEGLPSPKANSVGSRHQLSSKFFTRTSTLFLLRISSAVRYSWKLRCWKP